MVNLTCVCSSGESPIHRGRRPLLSITSTSDSFESLNYCEPALLIMSQGHILSDSTPIIKYSFQWCRHTGPETRLGYDARPCSTRRVSGKQPISIALIMTQTTLYPVFATLRQAFTRQCACTVVIRHPQRAHISRDAFV